MGAPAIELVPPRRIGWRPHPGSQRAFLECPIWEVLYEGSRGPGKSDGLLMDYAQHVGQGHGRAWRGVLFRRRYKHLDDLVTRAKRWFWQIWPEARWLSSKSDYKWVWPSGEELLFRAMEHPDEYWSYHGHEYPWIGWDELTNWPTDECYEQMKSCSRSSALGVPRKYRANANPWGSGHGWVKAYFIDAGPPEVPVRNAHGEFRVRIHGMLAENRALEAADPHYIRRLQSVDNPELRRAWVDGDWDVNPGGYLSGAWSRERHVIAPFEPPPTWSHWRAMDWGYARPFSVGWYARDPEHVTYRYRELYGWGGKADLGARLAAPEVAERILAAEARDLARGVRYVRNPADPELWANRGVRVAGRDVTPGSQMAGAGVRWVPAVKGPGSRRAGAQVVVSELKAGRFKIASSCRHWLRTVPSIGIDPDDWEDVDTEQEDHCWDETRYSLTSRQPKARVPQTHRPDPDPRTFAAVTTPEPPRRSRYRRH